MGGATELLGHCIVASDGFAAPTATERWQLGIVAHVLSHGAVAMVRKASAHREHYEFSDLWTLPGGMVRGQPEEEGPDGAAHLAASSLADRALKEAGLDLTACADDGFAEETGPLVSCYNTACGRRHTLVLVRRFRSRSTELVAADLSISEAAWKSIPPDWSSIAPVNLLAIAHLAWPALDEAQRADAAPHVSRATKTCSRWSHEVGLPAIPYPWDSDVSLAAWRRSFP